MLHGESVDNVIECLPEMNVILTTASPTKKTSQSVKNLLIVQDETGFETIFKGDDCVEEFTSWLLGRTHQRAIAIAHNLRGYDGFLSCEHLYKKLLLPKLTLNGAKIMSMELEEAEIKFCESLNFLPMPLKALPKTFGLTELKKGYFPHFFNR